MLTIKCLLYCDCDVLMCTAFYGDGELIRVIHDLFDKVPDQLLIACGQLILCLYVKLSEQLSV